MPSYKQLKQWEHRLSCTNRSPRCRASRLSSLVIPSGAQVFFRISSLCPLVWPLMFTKSCCNSSYHVLTQPHQKTKAKKKERNFTFPELLSRLLRSSCWPELGHRPVTLLQRRLGNWALGISSLSSGRQVSRWRRRETGQTRNSLWVSASQCLCHSHCPSPYRLTMHTAKSPAVPLFNPVIHTLFW